MGARHQWSEAIIGHRIWVGAGREVAGHRRLVAHLRRRVQARRGRRLLPPLLLLLRTFAISRRGVGAHSARGDGHREVVEARPHHRSLQLHCRALVACVALGDAALGMLCVLSGLEVREGLEARRKAPTASGRDAAIAVGGDLCDRRVKRTVQLTPLAGLFGRVPSDAIGR